MGEFVVGLPMSSAPSPITVLCLGHSHVAWLRTYVEAADWFAGFVVRGRPCNVEFLGVRGATLSTFLAPTMMERILAYRADVILIHVGGNDLDSRSFPNPIMVAIDIQRLALRLLGAEVKRVVVCQICRRQRWRRSSFSIGAERVVQVNRYLGLFCDETEGISFWRHKRLWNSIRPVFRSDGVHFSDIGNYRFFRSVRGAIITTVASLVG